jgi:cytochrome b6-f complex iron-sulfur subunit
MVAVVKAADAGQPIAAPKPASALPPKLPQKKEVSRRSAMQTLLAIGVSPFALAWTAVAAIGGLWGLGMARFMMPNMVLELPSRFKVGPPSDYPPGTVSEKYKASRGVWIVHSDQYDGRDIIYALQSVCTHLGCTPNWLEGEQKFKCPCHGSGFYITGINFEGPAPRPLERMGLRRAEDGMLEVDKSVKFQEELGQWSDPKSFMQLS